MPSVLSTDFGFIVFLEGRGGARNIRVPSLRKSGSIVFLWCSGSFAARTALKPFRLIGLNHPQDSRCVGGVVCCVVIV